MDTVPPGTLKRPTAAPYDPNYDPLTAPHPGQGQDYAPHPMQQQGFQPQQAPQQGYSQDPDLTQTGYQQGPPPHQDPSAPVGPPQTPAPGPAQQGAYGGPPQQVPDDGSDIPF